MEKVKPKIVAFVNANYIPVAKVWLQLLDELDLLEQVCLVALDEQVQAAFPHIELLYRPLPVAEVGFGALWAHRIAVLSEMLKAGQAIIHSDVDAMWARDPWPAIRACGASAVFSQGTFWPRDVHEQNRVVVCCGLFYLAADASVLAFLEKVDEVLESVQDDQIAMNRVIAAGIPGWSMEEPYEIPFRETNFLASRTPMHAALDLGEGQSLSLAVLPHHAFPRLIEAINDEVVVAHPLSGKSMVEKRDCMSRLGLWRTL